MRTFASVLSALLVVVGLYITVININFAGVPLIVVGGVSFLILTFTYNNKLKPFIIKGPIETDDNRQLYWSNVDGWGNKESATIFTVMQTYWPIETSGIEYIN